MFDRFSTFLCLAVAASMRGDWKAEGWHQSYELRLHMLNSGWDPECGACAEQYCCGSSGFGHLYSCGQCEGVEIC